MSIAPETLLELANLNLSSEQLAGVVRILARQAIADQERKEKQAERKRKQRMSRDNHGTVTGQSEDNVGTKAPPFSPLSPTPPIPPISPQKTTLLDGRADELYAALGEHANQRANGSFIALSEPINWINAGCDLDLDILPTVRSLAAKAKRITTWRFFDAAVFEARDRRLAPPPEIQPRQSSPPRHTTPAKRTFMDAYKDLEHERTASNFGNVVELPGNGGRS